MICHSISHCSELTLQLLIYGFSSGAVLALNAIGVTVVYSLVRILNLAQGDVFALTSVLITTLIGAIGVQPNGGIATFGILGLILIVAGVASALLMVLIERAAFQPFRGRSQLAPLMATLGISFILYQVALIWRTTLPSWIPQDHRSVPGLPEVPVDRIPAFLPNVDLMQWLGLPIDVTLQASDLLVLLLAVGAAIGVQVFLQRSLLGKSIRACAQNPLLAQLCGINLNQTIRWTFAFGGLLAALAAFVFALYYERPVGFHGAESGLLAFAAAILGGIGNPIGALGSGLLIGVFEAISDYFLSTQWTPVLLQLVLIAVLLFRPTGITAEAHLSDFAPTGRDAATTPELHSHSRLNRYLLQGFVLLALLFPAIDALLHWHREILNLEVGIYLLLALGLNLLLGLAGLLDLGYLVSFGIGAYLTAKLLPLSIDFLLILGLSIGFAALFGILKGKLVQRLQNDYLAVITLTLGLLGSQLLVSWDWTGGTGGIAALPPPQILSHPLSGAIAKYYLVLLLVLSLILISQRLIRSRIGRAWLASSEDETAAVSCGIDVPGYQLLAFTLSSGVAGLAGSLYAGSFAYVAPNIVSFQILAMVLAMVILGGAGNIVGAILGTLLITGYDKLFIPWLGSVLAPLQPHHWHFGSAPDVRGLSYFTFGLAIYLTILLRARQRSSV